VLIVAGDRDRVVPPASVRALAEAWGGARVVWLEGGHYDVIRHASSAFDVVREHLTTRFAAPR
jgi:pimeloyl-ACP methyl ester carboxylesterase